METELPTSITQNIPESRSHPLHRKSSSSRRKNQDSFPQIIRRAFKIRRIIQATPGHRQPRDAQLAYQNSSGSVRRTSSRRSQRHFGRLRLHKVASCEFPAFRVFKRSGGDIHRSIRGDRREVHESVQESRRLRHDLLGTS